MESPTFKGMPVFMPHWKEVEVATYQVVKAEASSIAQDIKCRCLRLLCDDLAEIHTRQ